MRTFRSILRGFLGLQAAVFLLIGTITLMGVQRIHLRTPASLVAAHARSGLVFALAVSATLLVLGAIYAIAWWTTRKPSPKLNPWALAASALNLAQGVLLALSSHLPSASRIRFSPADGLIFLATGAAGAFVFSRRGTSLDSAPEAVSVAGDRTNIWTRHAVTALSTITQIAALFFWSRWGFTQHLLRRQGLGWIALITAACITATLIHECGHAIFAWCFEMKLRSFKAGPFQWTSREGNWSFRFHAAGLVTPGGSISVTPSPSGQSAWEFILMIAAGPGANLLFGTAAAWAVLHDRWATYQQTWEFIAYTGAFCLIGAVLNLIPFLSEEGTYSDGARILQIATSSPLLNAPITPASASVEASPPLPAPPAIMPLRVTPMPEVAPELLPAALVAMPSLTSEVPVRPKPVPDSIRAADTAPTTAPFLPPKSAPPPEPIQRAIKASAVIPVVAAEPELEPEVADPIAARFLGAVARLTPPPARQMAEPPRVLRVPADPAAATPSIGAALAIPPPAPAAPAVLAPTSAAPAVLVPVSAAPVPAAPVPAAQVPAAPPTFVAAPEGTDIPALPSFRSSSGLQAADKQQENQEALAPASPLAVAIQLSPAPAGASSSAASIASAPAAPHSATPSIAASAAAPTRDRPIFVAAPESTNNPALPSFRSSSGHQAADKRQENQEALAPASPLPETLKCLPAPATPSVPYASIASAAPAAPAPPGSVPSPAAAQSTTTGVIASTTRIPVSAFSSTPRFSAPRSLPAPEPSPAAAGSPASGSKAPAVPPAFARRPRPAPLLSGLPDIEEILAAAAAAPEEIVLDDAIAVGESAPDTYPPATVTESAPLGPTFSETWPPRPASTQPKPSRSENHAVGSITSSSAPPPTPDPATAVSASEDAPQPEPEPRYDPFEFLRASVIESLTAEHVRR
jgi:Peptidase family M50